MLRRLRNEWSNALVILQYAILLASLGNSVAKYGIALVDLRRASQRGGENAPPWEDKSMLIFYVELATGTPTFIRRGRTLNSHFRFN